MSKQASTRKPLIIGIIAAVAILAALLGIVLTQCTGAASAPTTETTGEALNVENAELYWNVDRAMYDGKSDGGMSSRRAEKDGYFHIRFFKDGEFVELLAESRNMVNKIEVRDLMGLVVDDNGVIQDVIPIEDMPVQKVGWKFYVQSTGGTIIKVNSSNKFDGLEVLLDTKHGAKVYDMTGTEGEVGCEATAVINDRVMAVADMDGNLLAVYIYDRSNMIVEFQAHCQHCDEEVTWQEWSNEKQLPVTEGHYRLVTDVTLTGQKTIQADQKICLDLYGHTVNGASGSRVYSVHSLNAELAIMDTSEEQKGKLAAHGEIYAQGCVVWARSGNVYFYSGTLDASDAVCTGRGGAAVYVAADRYFYMYGGEIIGGTAKYAINETNGSYTNGLGGNVYVLGKFVMKDGVIRDGKALSAPVYADGKTSYKRGLGGNIYVGTSGEFVLDGGTISGGRAGSSGNIYMDGTAEFTMNGGTITGGTATDPGREGGNVNMGAKTTFTMNGGVISYGTSGQNVGNVYVAGTFVMQGGLITGGRTVDKQGKLKEEAPAANMYLTTAAKLYMYGGTITGSVAAKDGNSTDNKNTTIVLAGMPVIYDEKASANLTLQNGAEPVQLQVNNLYDYAKVGVTGTGKISLETEEKNVDNFLSDVKDVEVLYVDKCVALGKLACLCGHENHIGDCDGKDILWAPWSTKSSLPTAAGNYYLLNDVALTGNKSLGGPESTHTISLNLNGKSIVSKQRAVTSYVTLNIVDHVGGGEFVGAGVKTGKDHTGVILVFTDRKMNVYGGTIRLADDHYNISNGGLLGIAAGAEVNFYNGVLDGRSAEDAGTIADGAVARVHGTLNIHGGTVYGGAVTNRGGAFFVEKKGQLNILGGIVNGGSALQGGTICITGADAKAAISGGKLIGGTATTGGGIIRLLGNATVAISGGSVTGGTSEGKGGNIDMVSGKLVVSGGEILGGASVGNGGNIASSGGQVTISGGTIAGGTVKGSADNHTANVLVQNAGLVLSGGKVDGSLLVLSSNDTGNAKVTLSGEPVVTRPNTYGLRLLALETGTEPDLTIEGKLGDKASVAIDATEVFTTETVAENADKFIPADALDIIHFGDDKCMFVGRVHCKCESGEAEWCDHKAVRWSKWDGKTSIVSGNYYLTGDVTVKTTMNLGAAGQELNICLNGHTITGQDARIAKIDGNVSIFDHKDGKGTLISTGIGSRVDHSAVAMVSAGAELNLYRGTLKLAQDHNEMSGMGGVMAVAAGGTLNIYGGTVDASATSEKPIAAAGAIRVDGELNIFGGHIIGGKVTGGAGAILLRSATAVVNISGGTVTGGEASMGGSIYVTDGQLNISGGTIENGAVRGTGKGGNILLSGGSLNISGGEIKGGSAQQGGNIAAQRQDSNVQITNFAISGGEIHDGTAANANNSNLYMADTVLKLSGGKIAGGVSVINTTGTSAWVEVSGNPEIANDKGISNLRLHKAGGTQPVVKVVGALVDANIHLFLGPTATGVFAQPGESYTITEADRACFTPDNDTLRVGVKGTELELYVPHLHCWCENAENAPDHTCLDDQEWTSITGTKTMGDGCYYLNWTGKKAASITVSAGKHAYLCLNGAQIYAMKTVTLEEGSTLTICDCGTTGLIGVSGSGQRAPIQLSAESTVNLYSGSISGCYTGKEFPAVTVSDDSAVFNMYGGKLYCAESKPLSGANLMLTAGTANILGGTIEAGTAADSYGIRVDGGTLNLGGNVDIAGINLAEGKTITITEPLTGDVITVNAAEGIFVTGATEADKAKFAPANPKFRIVFEDGKLLFEKDPSGMVPKTLKYDDRKDIVTWLGLDAAPASVIISKQQVTSTQVGSDTADTAVLLYQDGTIYAVGVGTAVLTVDGEDYLVTVEPAKLSVFMITGHSLAVGQYGDANKSLVVEAGQAYSTYAANMDRKSEADVEALIDPNGGLGFGAADRAGATLDAFAPGQGGTTGEGSAIASSWIANTGEKVWILNAARGGSSINSWVPSTTNTGYENIGSHDLAVALFLEAQQVLQREIAAGHYTLGDMAVIYHNGGNFSTSNGLKDQNGELTFTWDQLKSWYDAMWNSYQTNFNKDIDGDGVVDTIKLAISNGGYSQNYDLPLGYYLGVTDPNMSTVLENYAKWKEDLSTFPTPNYEVQDGSQVKAPESHKHTAMGGTSDNSFYCDRDNTHLSQVAYNAMGLDVAANLYGALRGNRTLTAVEVRDSTWQQPTDVTLRIGQSWIYALVGTPYYGTGATVEATGAVAVDPVNPWIVHANEAGEGKLIVKVGTTVMKEVTFTVGDSHKHCWCAGSEVAPQGHTCDATVQWTAIPKVAGNKKTLENGGHYFLDWDGESAQSLVVAENAEVYLCLNGATIYAKKAITLNAKSVLHICDCSAEQTGTITVSGASVEPVIKMHDTGKAVNLYGGNICGTKGAAKVQAVVLSGGTRTFNMYGGTISGGYSTGDGGNVALTGGTPTFNMYGGTITGGNAQNGGNVYMLGKNSVFNMRGGQITGGVASANGANLAMVKGTFQMDDGQITQEGTAASNVYLNPANNSTVTFEMLGGTITGGNLALNIAGADVTLGGNVKLSSVTLGANTKLTLKEGLAAADPISVTMAQAGIFAVAEEGKTLSYAGKANFTSADASLKVACYTEGYALTDGLVGCACGMPTHHAGCSQLDPMAWSATDSLPTEGNYYLTAPVAVSAATEVAANKVLKLWLQGNDITPSQNFAGNKDGSKFIFVPKTGSTLELADSTAQSGTVYAAADTQEMIRGGGKVIIDGANLNASAITASKVNGLCVYVEAGGELLLKSGTLTGGITNNTGGTVYVVGGASMTMTGGTITGGTAQYGGNIGTRGTVTITGGSITNGTFTSRGGNIYAADGAASVSVSGETTVISGGVKSGNATSNQDRANICCWGGDLTLENVNLPGGIYVTTTDTVKTTKLTLKGKVLIAGGANGLTVTTLNSAGKDVAAVDASGLTDLNSQIDFGAHAYVKKAGTVVMSGLSEEMANKPVVVCKTSGWKLVPQKQSDNTYNLIMQAN